VTQQKCGFSAGQTDYACAGGGIVARTLFHTQKLRWQRIRQGREGKKRVLEAAGCYPLPASAQQLG